MLIKYSIRIVILAIKKFTLQSDISVWPSSTTSSRHITRRIWNWLANELPGNWIVPEAFLCGHPICRTSVRVLLWDFMKGPAFAERASTVQQFREPIIHVWAEVGDDLCTVSDISRMIVFANACNTMEDEWRNSSHSLTLIGYPLSFSLFTTNSHE